MWGNASLGIQGLLCNTAFEGLGQEMEEKWRVHRSVMGCVMAMFAGMTFGCQVLD